jgi:hypothetical protein
MLFRTVAAAISLLIPTPLAPASTQGLVVISPAAIMQVWCVSPKWISAGTAFRVGPSLSISVNHVTSAPGTCAVGGKAMDLAYKSPTLDFSELLTDEGPYLQIDCGGFVKGRKYLALGFARAIDTLTTVELTATGKTSGGQEILYGIFSVVPGMSGGPLVSEDTGRVVGTVNREDFEDGISLSVPLSSTPLCKKDVA